MKKFLLTWNPPSNASPTGYIIQYSTDGLNWNNYSIIENTTSGFVTGLNTCQYYSFRLAGLNNAGTGLFSSTATGIMGLIPYAPISLNGTAYTGSIDLSWTVPNNGGCSITNSIIEYSGLNQSLNTILTNTGISSYLLTGLSSGLLYTIRVAAINAVGTGAYSTGINISTVGPLSEPTNLSVQYIEQLSAPTGLSYISKNSQITLRWSGVDDTNSIPLSGYTINYKLINSANWTNTGLLYTTSGILGLTNCTGYLFEVAAVNNSGTIGLYSSTLTGIVGLPDAPYNISSNGGNYGSETNVTYSAPANNGSAITGYRYYFNNIKVDPASDDLSGNANFSSNYDNQILKMSAVNNCGEGPLSTGVVTIPFSM
jgi:titin